MKNEILLVVVVAEELKHPCTFGDLGPADLKVEYVASAFSHYTRKC